MASFYEGSETKNDTKTPKFLTKVEMVNQSENQATTANGVNTNESPIFSKRKMPLRIPATYSSCDLTHLTVSKNWLVCLLISPQQTTMLRFFLLRALPPGEIVLDKYLAGYKISKLFLDHTGHHTLISLVPKTPGLSADFLYIHGNGPKIRRIEKFKDHEITAVAFNTHMGTESSTGAILLGTSRGLIFETELLQDADKPSYRKQVYDLGLGRPKYPITGLEVLHIPNTNKYSVVATAPDCIYTFQEALKPEEKSLQPIFSTYVNGTQAHTAEMIKTDLNYSVLRFYALPNEHFPKQWAWLTGSGLRFGEVSSDKNSSEVLLGESLISLSSIQRETNQKPPTSLALTEYHALLMYSNHITGICLLSEEIVYEEYFDEQIGKLLNIVRDPFTGAIYLYTDKTVFNYKIQNEERNIWKIYLNKGLYDMAEIYAAEHPEQLDIVRTKHAEVAFDEEKYEMAANIFSETEKPFEEICLKFMELDDKRPIIMYVKRRLNGLPDSPQHVMILVVWLIDLYLTQINLPGQTPEERSKWQREYDEFMKDKRVIECTRENRTVIQNLIEQHADTHNLSQFAIANEDYELVINQHLNAENYKEALTTLRKQKNMDLYYKYGPILMERLPQETVEVLMSQGRKLQIEELVPTLVMTESPKHIEQIIKYLEYAIYNLGETHQAIHNFLLRLYAEHRPDKVITYLNNEGNDISLVHYDINYALSVCTQYDVKMACVFVQCLLGMWSSAVDLALTFDVKLAKETAAKPTDVEMRRKLWLRIAYHDIKDTDDVEKALALLKECDLLRIEDLLPYFSDFEKIDNFKEPICKALKEYNQQIEELQHEMQEWSKQAERVRNELQNVRQHSTRIEANEDCSICETYLLVKPFFIFSCGHKYHSDCLEKQVVPLLTPARSRKLTMLKQQFESALTQSTAMADHSRKQQQKREQLKQDIEEILASDCLYCGLMIDTIDQPFVDDWEKGNVDWE